MTCRGVRRAEGKKRKRKSDDISSCPASILSITCPASSMLRWTMQWVAVRLWTEVMERATKSAHSTGLIADVSALAMPPLRLLQGKGPRALSRLGDGRTRVLIVFSGPLGTRRGGSSVGSSVGLIILRSWVRSPPAPSRRLFFFNFGAKHSVGHLRQRTIILLCDKSHSICF